MVRMPSSKVFDGRIPLFGQPEQRLLISTVGTQVDSITLRVGAAGEEVYNHQVYRRRLSAYVADVFASFFSIWMLSNAA